MISSGNAILMPTAAATDSAARISIIATVPSAVARFVG
jgi:hypothetical protein